MIPRKGQEFTEDAAVKKTVDERTRNDFRSRRIKQTSLLQHLATECTRLQRWPLGDSCVEALSSFRVEA